VSQISPPIRIVLICAVALTAAYMLFLRPKDEVVPAPPTPAPNVQTAEPAVSGPGQAAEAAQGAVDATNSHLQAQEGVDGVDAGESAAATGTAGAAGTTAQGGTAVTIPTDLEGVPAPIAKAIGKQQVVVLLFWNAKSADDRAVRTELRRVDGWGGRVYKHAAPITSISKYGRITRGADVEQSPTVVVVDPELRADTLVGYVDAATIDQTVVDAMRNSTGLFTDAYLREINQVCVRYNNAWATPAPAPTNGSELSSGVTTGRAKWARFERDFKAVDAPKRWRTFDRAAVRDHAAAATVYADLDAYLGANPSVARVQAGAARFGPRLERIERRYDRRMDAEYVLSCGSDA